MKLKSLICVLTVVAAAGCSFDKSGVDGEEPADATAIDTGVGIDTAVAIDSAPADAASCSDVCQGIGNCNNETCEISCIGDNACNSQVQCPAGVACDVNCFPGENSAACSGGIVCPAGQPCDINCTSTSAHGGTAECSGPIDCSSSCACDVNCNQLSAQAGSNPVCAGGVTCPTGCDDGNGGCTSQGPGCNTCGL